jgi:hypothetical protein
MNDDKIEGLGRSELIVRLSKAEGQLDKTENRLDSVLMVIAGSQILWVAARTAHEANRAYCESLGDMSQPEWLLAPQWQKDSAGEGVWDIIENVNLTPQQSHENWMSFKAKEGWVYGPVKDAEAKTHPCMVPYEQLPKEQQFKDALFGAVVRGVLGI